MGFIPDYTPPTETRVKDALYFLIKEQDIIVKRGPNRFWIPSGTDISLYNLDLQNAHFIGTINDHPCYAFTFPQDCPLLDSLQALSLRDAFTLFSSHEIHAISLAKQILTWDRNFRFCGRCGEPTTEHAHERAKVCSHCGLTNYPRLSPSIIVSVVKDDQILLARSEHFPGKMYSVLAGFVEPGETLEQCIQREVVEEVGLEVHNIRYFGSQNWPFPHSLMIGFTADYLRGDIVIDNKEIVEAKWFTAQKLPQIPGRYSIAREIIDYFCNNLMSAGDIRR